MCDSVTALERYIRVSDRVTVGQSWTRTVLGNAWHTALLKYTQLRLGDNDISGSASNCKGLEIREY